MVNYYITQNIYIHQLKLGAVTNSSVFQIGTAGIIKAMSSLNNSGGYEDVVPSVVTAPGQEIEVTRGKVHKKIK